MLPLVRETVGGTLVLEEIGDLPQAMQKRLLEFWDAQAADPDLAGPHQWICTTNAPDETLLAAGGLGEDFCRRFLRIRVPPLRERKEDIPALVAYFSKLMSSREASLQSLQTLAERLAGHSFPGNVRELESLMTLEAGGLPWRWRVAGADKSHSVRVRPLKAAGTTTAKSAAKNTTIAAGTKKKG